MTGWGDECVGQWVGTQMGGKRMDRQTGERKEDE